MRSPTRRRLLAGTTIAAMAVPTWAAPTLAAPALAAPAPGVPDWPDRPVRLIVPFPPGGSNDIVARLLAEALRDGSGQSILVENRPGAGGNIGAEAVVRAPPDGQVLLVAAPGPFAINEHLYRTMPFDAARDLLPVALVATVPVVLLVPADSPARDLAGLIALAKRQPGRLAFGSSSVGGTNHLAGELLKGMAGIELTHVPYRGAAPAMTDLIAGRLQLYFDNMPGVLPQLREGRVRALAVAGASRASALPDVPTMAEAGLPGFEASSWFGMAAPGGTPPALARWINAAVRAALAAPALRERLAGVGAEPGALTTEAFAGFVLAERTKWGEVVRASGARAD